MDEKTITKQKGIRMAMRVAALSLGAGAAVMALTASDATAKEEAQQVTLNETEKQPAANDNAAAPVAAEVNGPMEVTGWSCWGPTSRGPLAPPAQSDDDFLALLAEVPA